MAKSQKNGDDPKKKAEQLMKSSEVKKKAAAQQETLGKAQIKNKVKEGSMGSIAPYTKKMGDIGKPIPVGQQRLDIAKKLRQEASKDSLKAVKMYPPITPKKKK